MFQLLEGGALEQLPRNMWARISIDKQKPLGFIVPNYGELEVVYTVLSSTL